MSDRSPWMNEELRIFRRSVRRFVETELAPHEPRWRAQHRPDAEAWAAAGRAGMLLPGVPEEYGGGGGTLAHEIVVCEELARAGVHFGSGIQCIVARYILAYGTEAQKQRWLRRMASGELVGAIAMSEPGAGSDLSAIATTARRDGDTYVVNGSKTFISNGWHAGLVCLAVKTDTAVAPMKGLSLLVVEAKDLAGYTVGRSLEKIGMHAQDTCELFFDDVRVPAANLIGPAEGQGFFQMMEQLPYERLTIGAGAVAAAERAVAITADYVKERMAGGRAADRVPEHALQARRMQDRGADRPRLPRPLHRALPRRLARRGRAARWRSIGSPRRSAGSSTNASSCTAATAT